ncbi:hypothetical protein [Modestobacter lapidis]|nr:hypothetical protein [Modestobacter lapidis]
MDRSDLTPETITDPWQKFQAEHIGRQTKALESMRGMLTVWMVFTVIGVVMMLLTLSN